MDVFARQDSRAGGVPDRHVPWAVASYQVFDWFHFGPTTYLDTKGVRIIIDEIIATYIVCNVYGNNIILSGSAF